MYNLSNFNIFVCYNLKLLLIQSVKKISAMITLHIWNATCWRNQSEMRYIRETIQDPKHGNCRDSTSKRSASIENTKLTNSNTVSSAQHLSNIPNRWIIDEAAKVIQKQNIYRRDSTYRMPRPRLRVFYRVKMVISVKITPVGRIFYSFHHRFASMA
jgi:hypothetical protein